MDCKAHLPPVEQLICRDPAALQADARLNTLYQEVLEADPAQAAPWRADQLDWLAQRDDAVWTVLNETAVGGGPVDPDGTARRVLEASYQARLTWLDAGLMRTSLRQPLLAQLQSSPSLALPSNREQLPPQGAALASVAWLKRQLPGVVLAQPIERWLQPPGAGLSAALVAMGPLHTPRRMWLDEAQLGGAYVIDGTAHCQAWTLFQRHGGQLDPLPPPATLVGRCEPAAGDLLSYQGQAYAVAVDLESTGLSVQAQRWRDGGWDQPELLVMHYGHQLQARWADCGAAGCEELAQLALKVADRYDHQPEGDVLWQPAAGTAEATRFASLLDLATHRPDLVDGLARSDPRAYPGTEAYGAGAVYWLQRWQGRWLLGRIGHPTFGWRRNDGWMVSLWDQQQGQLVPVAGFVFEPRPTGLRIAQRMPPPPTP